MLFNSVQFVAFFAVVCGVHFATPRRWRWVPMLVASYVFYMAWRLEYGALILISTAIDYGVGRALPSATSHGRRRVLLAMSLVGNLGLLFGFKYLDFTLTNLNSLGQLVGLSPQFPTFNVLLPVGISFYTFQSLSYTFDVYRGVQTPERHFGRFAVFVAFFPQLIAGPIERSGALLPQLEAPGRVRMGDLRVGCQLMLWGAFKKIVIADHAGVVVSTVYDQPALYPAGVVGFAVVLFAVQLYTDFSGYCDIAVGVARLMGIRLSTNFRRPFFARSVADYWRRRHITLGRWFRDYVYFPLGGSRAGQFQTAVNISAVFLLSGLWHGASWTFVFWGGLNALALITERALSPHLHTVYRSLYGPFRWGGLIVKHLLMFAFLWLTLVFFRAESVTQASAIFAQLFAPEQMNWWFLTSLGLKPGSLAVLLVAILTLFAVEWVQEFEPRPVWRLWSRRWIRWVAYLCVIYTIALFGFFGRAQFIYFQF